MVCNFFLYMFITIEKLGTSYNKLHNFSKLFYFASFLKNGLYDGILILHFQNAFYTFRESVSKKVCEPILLECFQRKRNNRFFILHKYYLLEAFFWRVETIFFKFRDME